MKCTSKKITVMLCLSCMLMSGCGQRGFPLEYTVNSSVSSYRMIQTEAEQETLKPFASDLCVVSEDITDSIAMKAAGVGLFDVNHTRTVYAKNVYEQLAPASLTKVMTALVALKHGSPDMMLTASENVRITESGAQLLRLKAGDQMTLSQALHVLLIYSANDVAIMIAEGIAGSVDEFCRMMNEEAAIIGATGTNFVNPHGLSEDNHYTTVYDMYLIMNEAIEYSLFNEIIHMSTYTSTYTDREGNSREIDIKNTNLYLHGDKPVPEYVTVTGGKTGTTSAAGSCLIIVCKDTYENPYISIIMKAENRDELYGEMTDLLKQIQN